MTHSTTHLRQLKTDALFGKKKHFNAAARIKRYHNWIGIPLVVFNVLLGSALYRAMTEQTDVWLKHGAMLLAILAALLSALQTFFNFNKRVAAHRRIGNDYLRIYKETKLLLALYSDGAIANADYTKRIEDLEAQAAIVNKSADNFLTSASDYARAKQGIRSGEENYTDEELKL